MKAIFKINRFKRLMPTLLGISLYFHSILVWADKLKSTEPSLGDAAQGLLVPVGVFTTIIYNACYIIGVAFVLGSIIRFKEYRENSSQTPISRPIVMCIFGIIIFCIPFIAKLSAGSSAAGV